MGRAACPGPLTGRRADWAAAAWPRAVCHVPGPGRGRFCPLFPVRAARGKRARGPCGRGGADRVRAQGKPVRPGPVAVQVGPGRRAGGAGRAPGAPRAAPGVPARPRAVCLAQRGHAGAHARQRGAEQPRAARRAPAAPAGAAVPVPSRGPPDRDRAELPGCRDLDPGRFRAAGPLPGAAVLLLDDTWTSGASAQSAVAPCARPGPGMWRWWCSAVTWGRPPPARSPGRLLPVRLPLLARPAPRPRRIRAWPPPGPRPSAWTAARCTVTRMGPVVNRLVG